ncbi:MAG: LptA/OstA family protein, partial [Opitutales bacterium]
TAIRDFAIPQFDEEGRRLSMLRGKELSRHPKDEATVLEMDLRTYAVDRPGTMELRIRSSSARFFLKSNRATSDQVIQVNGPDYEITGRGWSWNGRERKVLINHDVRSIFDATLTDFLASGCGPEKIEATPEFPLRPVPKDQGQTRIFSTKLELLTTDKDHRFLFLGEVRIIGLNLNVTCDRLEVISTRTLEKKEEAGAFGSIAHILALGRVRIEQRQRSAVAGKATIDVAAGTIVLEEDPVVFDDQGKATGHRIILYRGQRRAEVQGKPGGARPTVTLPPLRDLDGIGKVKDEGKDQKESSRPDSPGENSPDRP